MDERGIASLVRDLGAYLSQSPMWQWNRHRVVTVVGDLRVLAKK